MDKIGYFLSRWPIKPFPKNFSLSALHECSFHFVGDIYISVTVSSIKLNITLQASQIAILAGLQNPIPHTGN